MAVQTSTHLHGTLHIDLIANTQCAKIGAQECLLHGSNDIFVAIDAHHGEANAIVGNALIDAKFVRERAG